MQTLPLLSATLYFTEVLLHLERMRLSNFIVVVCEMCTISVLNVTLLCGISRYFNSEGPWKAFSSMKIFFLWMFIVNEPLFLSECVFFGSYAPEYF